MLNLSFFNTETENGCHVTGLTYKQPPLDLHSHINNKSIGILTTTDLTLLVIPTSTAGKRDGSSHSLIRLENEKVAPVSNQI